MLISLRKHIDEYRSGQSSAGDAGSGMSEAAVTEFREMLLTIGRCGERAVPAVGTDLKQTMTSLRHGLVQPVTADALSKTNRRAQAELSGWAERAFSHHQELEKELQEILSVVSAAALSVGERDEKYASEIGALTGRLGSIASGDDIAHMRTSIMESTRALKDCVARMTEESKTLVTKLTEEVTDYRTRFEAAERASLTDSLTQLSNRRGFERDLDMRIAAARPFSMISMDLDSFKGINDQYGHPFGDEVLRLFAAELRGQFQTGELVARLGGDEFLALTGGGIEEAHRKIDRIRKWALGEYKIRHREDTVRIDVRASIGAAEWAPGESAADLVARVDAEVYKAKEEGKRSGV